MLLFQVKVLFQNRKNLRTRETMKHLLIKRGLINLFLPLPAPESYKKIGFTLHLNNPGNHGFLNTFSLTITTGLVNIGLLFDRVFPHAIKLF